MKIKDIRKKSRADLTKRSIKLREDIAAFDIERITKDDKNFKKSRNMRRELARILTVLNEPEVVKTDKKTESDDKEKK